MRRRRTTRSPVSSPVHTIDAGCRESSKPFAAYVNPNDLVSLCRTTLIGLYYDFFDSINRMALGLTGWWGARDDGADGEAEEGVKLLDQPGGEKKVKRRRRKEEVTEVTQYFPGMVNLSGVLCYMNSVLQSLASIPSLVNHLERIIALAVEADMPTPVADALSDVLRDLNTPQRRQSSALRPHELLHALQPLPQIRRLLSTREQQDAHELFVVLAEAVSDEALKVAAEVVKLRGIAEVLSLPAYCMSKTGGEVKRNVGKEKRVKTKGLAQPWEGLMARRRVCRRCGWSEAVRMDTLGGMELPVPLHGDTTLDACIAEYLAPELLTGVTCEKCSLRQTIDFYRSEATRLSLPPSQSHLNGHANHSSTASGSSAALENLPSADSSGSMTDKRKKKARDARRVETRLQEMLESNAVAGFEEPSLPTGPSGSKPLPIKWQKVNTDSVREGLITRVPQSLRLHFIRSGYTPYGSLVKKTARVAFPLILNMSPFVSRGVWEERSDVRSLLAEGLKTGKPPPRMLYRLESAILHYGYTHSSGHFVCIRRKPRKDGDLYRPSSVRKSCPDGCSCESCMYFGQVREPSVPGRGWLQVSDADVEEVGEEALVEARGAVFMLLYERVGEYEGPRGKGVELERGASQSTRVSGEDDFRPEGSHA